MKKNYKTPPKSKAQRVIDKIAKLRSELSPKDKALQERYDKARLKLLG